MILPRRAIARMIPDAVDADPGFARPLGATAPRVRARPDRQRIAGAIRRLLTAGRSKRVIGQASAQEVGLQSGREDPAALDRVVRALEAVIAEMR